MALKILKDLKKKQEFSSKEINLDQLIIGEDFYAFWLLHKLRKDNQFQNDENGKDQKSIKIIRPQKHVEQHFDFPPHGDLWPLRGEVNAKVFRTLFPEIPINALENQPCFYKEQKFRPFGGRFKNEPLKPGEECFLETPYFFDSSSFNIGPSIQSDSVLDVFVKTIEFLDCEDGKGKLIKVECTDGTCIMTRQLFFAETPALFFDLLRNKEDFDVDFLQACQSIQNRPCLEVAFDLTSGPGLFETRETLFIPQSQTHEWGHFIGEFRNPKSFSFFTYLDPDNMETEEISKKIRLLERTLEKVFPPFERAVKNQVITLKNRSPYPIINDEDFDRFAGYYPNLFFIGTEAPLTQIETYGIAKEERKFITNMIRAVLSIESALK